MLGGAGGAAALVEASTGRIVTYAELRALVAAAAPAPGVAFVFARNDLATVVALYGALEAGVPLFAYGNFITVLINFLILAFIIFQMVRLFNRAQRLVIADKPAAAPAAPPEDVLLLREIRDSLRRPA